MLVVGVEIRQLVATTNQNGHVNSRRGDPCDDYQ
jgi:hypothetical protein